MSLPNPSMSFSPFAILTAEELNDLVENIEALADGSGLDGGAVTPDKRSGGFFNGVISGATLGTTGNKAITGVGFKPKRVRFTVLGTASTAAAGMSIGSMTANGQFTTAVASNAPGGTPGFARYSSQSNCISFVTGGSITPNLLASRVSLDTDGFTINVTTALNSFDVAYEAEA